MDILIIDKHNKQILRPMSVLYNTNGSLRRIDACKVGDDPLTAGWYSITGEHLENVKIVRNTGLKDSDGNAIYEGAVLDYKYDECTVSSDEQTASFIAANSRYLNAPLYVVLARYGDNIKVIGNAFLNEQ